MMKFIISTAFLSGAFLAGATFAKVVKKNGIVEKIEKVTIKKNLSASLKEEKY